LLSTSERLNVATPVRRFALSTPAATAVIEGRRTLTYGELDARANQLANALRERGLRPGDPVAVFTPNRLECYEMIAGLGKAGMPLVRIDPRSPARDLEQIAYLSGVRALLVDSELAHVACDARKLDRLNAVACLGGDDIGIEYEDFIGGSSTSEPDVGVDELDPFAIHYTSGTAGLAKAVQISHRAIALSSMYIAPEWGLGPASRVFAVAPIFHRAGFDFSYCAMHVGACVVVLRSFDPESFLQTVEAERPECAFMVPSHAQILQLVEDQVLESDT
jgi:acyl-CoA synthetase (AMP-forming)/AMP-acid ligase II